MKGILRLIDVSAATAGTLNPLELVRSRYTGVRRRVHSCSDITLEMVMSIFIPDRHAVSQRNAAFIRECCFCPSETDWVVIIGLNGQY